MISPWTLAAATATVDMSQTSRATRTTTTKPTGIAYLAGQRSPAIRTPITAMGESAKRLRARRLSIGRLTSSWALEPVSAAAGRTGPP